MSDWTDRVMQAAMAEIADVACGNCRRRSEDCPGCPVENLDRVVKRAKAKAGSEEEVLSVYDEVKAERNRQDNKWEEQNHDPFLYLTILGEEYGEACQAALQTRFGGKAGGLDKLREELVQTAAVAIGAIECLDRQKWSWGGHALGEDDHG